jgi:hypothetical protein
VVSNHEEFKKQIEHEQKELDDFKWALRHAESHGLGREFFQDFVHELKGGNSVHGAYQYALYEWDL